MIAPVTMNVALSGLAAASKRFAVSATNVANQFSTKSRIDGVETDQPYTPKRVEQLSLDLGGVETRVRDVNPPTVTVFKPEDPDADANGAIQMPNVDLEEEIVNQKLASYDYKANLRTIKVQDDMQQSLLDILS